MIEHKKVRKTVTEEAAIICDCCKRRCEPGDWEERQEFLRWRTRGGYGSIFGDGEEVALDLCQHCVKKRLGKFLQFHGNAYDPNIL